MPLVVVVAWLCSYAVPEENRYLAGRNFCANFAFSCKIAIFHKFCLGAQFFANLRPFGAHCFAKFTNFAICAQLARRYLRFPAKVHIFCAGLAYN